MFGNVAITRPSVVAGVQGAAGVGTVVPGRCDRDRACSEHLWSGLSNCGYNLVGPGLLGKVPVTRGVLEEASWGLIGKPQAGKSPGH